MRRPVSCVSRRGRPPAAWGRKALMVPVLAGLAAILAALIGALVGGLAGMRFHRNVDKAGLEPTVN